MRYPMSEEEKKWRRRDDARTLAEAEAIKADSERFKEAKQGAKEILQEEAIRLKGLSKVVSNPTVTKTVKNAEKTEQETQFQRRTISNPATIGRF